MKAAKEQIAGGKLQAARLTLAMCKDFPTSDEFKAFAAKAEAAIVAQEKDAAIKEAARKRSEGVQIGMTQPDVLASSWGSPQKVNTTTTARGTREQWVYGGHNYLYFENGLLTAIQN